MNWHHLALALFGFIAGSYVGFALGFAMYKWTSGGG